MENASDALIMAGSVLLFIIALTVAISSFTSLRVQFDEIAEARDQVQMSREYDATTGNYGDYINFLKNDISKDIRQVRVEAIITTIRRMRKENYVMYLSIPNLINTNILKEFVVKNTDIKEQLYGNNTIISQSSGILLKFSMDKQDIIFYDKAEGEINLRQELNNELLSELYKIAKDNTFKEYIGEYRLHLEGVSDANDKSKKIITYIQN